VPAHPVSIVIPTWNGREILQRFLPSVTTGAAAYASASGAAVEIVVVDDGSSDGTREWLVQFAMQCGVPLRGVAHERNLGFGEACNTGMREARYDLALLLNNDVEITAGTIAPLITHFTDDPKVFAVHCKAVDLASGRAMGRGQAGGFRRGFLRVHDGYEPDASEAPPFRSIFASGGSTMFRRRRFIELGGFDPIFAPFYYEDVELSYRAWKRGWSVHYEPASTIRHQFSSTIGSAGKARIRRVSARNRLLWHWIHLHDRGLFTAHLAWLPAILLGSIASLRPTFVLGFVDAARGLAAVRTRRVRERKLAVRTDRQVLAATRRTPETEKKGPQ
jgi:GT2 family glycosyltransferase